MAKDVTEAFLRSEKMDVSERKKEMVDVDSEVRPLVVAVMISKIRIR